MSKKSDSNLRVTLPTFLLFTLGTFQLSAQQYTYTVESFEESVWLTSESKGEVLSSTGKWINNKATSNSSIKPPTGSRCIQLINSGSFQTPELTEGAGTITLQAYTGLSDSRRTITILASIDGSDFVDIYTTPALSNSDWQLITIPIKDVNVRYIQFSSGSGVVFDDVLITPYSIVIKPEILSGLMYVHNTGPGGAEPSTVSAINLTAGDPIIVTTTKNFEISCDGITWGLTTTIPNPAGGSLPPTTVYTRLVSGLAVGKYSGTLSVSGGGKSVPTTSTLSGSVSAPSTSVCISGEMLMNIRKDDFGTFPGVNDRSPAMDFYIDTIFKSYTTDAIRDFGYSILAESFTDDWTVAGPDHTPDDPAGTFGAMLFVNNGETEGKIVYSRAWPVCGGMNLTMSAWYADANNHIVHANQKHVPGITFHIYGGSSPDNCNTLIVKQSESPPFAENLKQIWHQILVPFNTGNYSYIKLEITNDVNEILGNDLLIDDIEFPTAPLPVEICATNVTCHGACDGVITVSRVSGDATFTFVLDGKVTKSGKEATFTNLCAGTHTIKILDPSGGCDVVPEVIIHESPEFVAKAISLPDCDASGTIGMLVSGGTPGYQYREGSGTWSSNSVITGLAKGSHTIEVKDAMGCITSATTNISMSAATLTLTSAAGTDAQTLRMNSSITDITYTVGGSATGATITGLPTGLLTSYASGVFSIHGTPTQSGTFNYTVTTTGTDSVCATSLAGTITINGTITAQVTDENGNGFIDRINFTIEEILAATMPSASAYFKTLKITNHHGKVITLRPQEIKRINDNTFAVFINENSGADFETGWMSADFSTNNVSVMASGALTASISIVDKAGPVIQKAVLTPGLGEGTERIDTLSISFSEPLHLPQSSTTPVDIFQYYHFATKTLEALSGIKNSDMLITDDKLSVKVLLTNDYNVQPLEDSLQLKSIVEHVTDLSNNAAHESSRIVPIEGTLRLKFVNVTLILHDANGNGFIDIIQINLPNNNSLSTNLPAVNNLFTKHTLETYMGNVTLQPQQIEQVSSQQIKIALHENSGTRFETGWTSSSFDIASIPLTIDGRGLVVKKVIDSAGPVIARVLYQYGEEGKNEDILTITFSEPVVQRNSLKSTPSDVFNYYQRDKLSTNAFESINVQSFPFEVDMGSATVVMTNGFFILPTYDSLQLKQVPDHMVDTHGNSAHTKSRIAAIEGKLRITITVKTVVNPYEQGTALPEKYLEYYSDVLQDGDKNVVLVGIRSSLPLTVLRNGSLGEVVIYDCVGNMVQRDIQVRQGNSPLDYGFTWNLKNKNNRNVNQGIYLAIIKVKDFYNTEHVFREKIGIK